MSSCWRRRECAAGRNGRILIVSQTCGVGWQADPPIPFWPRTRLTPARFSPPFGQRSAPPIPPVGESPVAGRRLAPVTQSTERLPTAAVPEDRRIAAMRIDMVHDGRGPPAGSAGRMRCEECPARLTPCRRAIQGERYAIAPSRIVPVALGLVSPADGTADRRLPGHDNRPTRMSSRACSVSVDFAGARVSRACGQNNLASPFLSRLSMSH